MKFNAELIEVVLTLLQVVVIPTCMFLYLQFEQLRRRVAILEKVVESHNYDSRHLDQKMSYEFTQLRTT